MKHAAVLYTCVGLMGAAAITGFVDYTRASHDGSLKDLYAEKRTTPENPIISVKEIDMEDYSRGPIEEYTSEEQLQQDELAMNAQQKQPKKAKKKTAPPPPPPPPPKKSTSFETLDEPVLPAPPAPPAPPEEIKDITPPPPPPPAPKEEKQQTPAVTPAPPAAPEVAEPKRISFKSFSRAPLPSKRKKN